MEELHRLVSSSPSWNLSILSWGLITSLSIYSNAFKRLCSLLAIPGGIISIVVVVAEPSEDSQVKCCVEISSWCFLRSSSSATHTIPPPPVVAHDVRWCESIRGYPDCRVLLR
eukprot:scaffold10154_cov63-Cyclotella_meneghiniana.AAC.5